MSKILNTSFMSRCGAIGVLSAATLLSACVVQERVYRPPPPAPTTPASGLFTAAPAAAVRIVRCTRGGRRSPRQRTAAAVAGLRPTAVPGRRVSVDLPATGIGRAATIIGYRALGSSRRRWAYCGHRAIGAFVGGFYGWHVGYWGPHVGFYGGVNYGFGYVGVGFAGGRWAGNSFAYNRAVVNVNTTVIHNTYNTTVVNNVTVNKVSFNGGAGGVAATPTQQERVAAQEQHVAPTAAQRQHVQEAVRNPALSARANGGHPSIAATSRAGAFKGPGVVGARGAGAPGAGHSPSAGQPNGARAPVQGQANTARPPNGGAARPQGANGRQPPPGQKAAPRPQHPQGEAKKHEPEKSR